DARGFMTEQDRHRIAQAAFDHLEIGMAKPHSLDADEDILGRRFACLDRLDDERRFRRVQHGRLVLEPHFPDLPPALFRMPPEWKPDRSAAPPAPRRYRRSSFPTRCRNWQPQPS